MPGHTDLLHRYRRVLLVITICLWIVACTLTHLPPDKVPNFHTSDTYLHTIGFGGLASWFLLTLVSFRTRTLPRILLVLVVMAAYGALDENTQPFFGRTCELRDWVNDMIGTAIAVTLWEIALWAMRKHGKA
jgi:VanZ family protein